MSVYALGTLYVLYEGHFSFCDYRKDGLVPQEKREFEGTTGHSSSKDISTQLKALLNTSISESVGNNRTLEDSGKPCSSLWHLEVGYCERAPLLSQVLLGIFNCNRHSGPLHGCFFLDLDGHKAAFWDWLPTSKNM